VVDDKWANRQLLLKLLNPLGFEMREAQNGQEAFEVWQEFAPHLIWMDMRMPVMDGFEATRRIKAGSNGQATVIIALTASSLEEERAIVLSAGCDDFVRKPFREAEIFELMSKHIGVRYVYEAVSPAGEDTSLGSQVSLENLRSQISALPLDLLTSLREGTELGDLEMIDGIITQIRQHDPALAETLGRLANNFEYDKMLSLIQRVAE
jgi:CheY-like chemotaxis protein